MFPSDLPRQPSMDAVLSEIADRVDAASQARGPEAPQVPDVADEAQLARYLDYTFHVRLPNGPCCPFHVTPWRAFCDAYFARHPVIVVKGSRGLAGKTFFGATLAMACGALLGADVTILAGSGGQSRRLHKAMGQLWGAPNAPRYLLQGDPGVMKTVFAPRDGYANEIEALTASQTSARSPHPQRLILDEVDEMDWEVFQAATGQTMKARGIAAQTTIMSTHQYDGGTFSKVLEMAAERGWPVHSWCWRETIQPHGWLDPAEVDRKRGEMSKKTFDNEIELAEPSSEGRAIDQDAVDRMFDAARETDGDEGREEEFEPPDPAGSYSTGGDWGKTRDFSAIPTLRTDVRPMRFVVFYRARRRPYPSMVPVYDRRMERYRGIGAHDANGLGQVIDDLLTVDKEFVIGYTHWQGAARYALFSEYIAAVEKGEVAAPRSLPWYRAHKHVTNDDLYGDGHPPDEFVGCALAYHAFKHPPKRKPQGMSGALW